MPPKGKVTKRRTVDPPPHPPPMTSKVWQPVAELVDVHAPIPVRIQCFQEPVELRLRQPKTKPTDAFLQLSHVDVTGACGRARRGLGQASRAAKRTRRMFGPSRSMAQKISSAERIMRPYSCLSKDIQEPSAALTAFSCRWFRSAAVSFTTCSGRQSGRGPKDKAKVERAAFASHPLHCAGVVCLCWRRLLLVLRFAQRNLLLDVQRAQRRHGCVDAPGNVTVAPRIANLQQSRQHALG